MSREKIFDLPAYGWRPRRDQVPVWRQLVDPGFQRGNIVAHRRYGKDELALQMLAVKAMSRVGSYWYALPEYEQARKAIWTMVNWRTHRARIDDAFPPEIVAKRDNDGMHLTLASGSTIQLVGSDRVDSLVGGGQIGIVMSEAALSNPKAKQFFMPILEESKGWLLEISTPRGKNAFYRSHIGLLEDMRNGEPGRFAAFMAADKTDVFPPEQLFKIRMDLIREHGQKLGTALFEQEYMCSFTAALVGSVWGDECANVEREGRAGKFTHDRRFPVNTSWDIGVNDPTVIHFWQDISGYHRLIDTFTSTDLGLDSYAAMLRQKHHDLGYHYGVHIGPHDIKQREWLRGVSRMDEAKRLGLEFKRMPNTRLNTQIVAGAHLLNRMEVNTSNPDVEAVFEHFKGYHYQTNKTTGTTLPTPVHDEHSHPSSAMMTYALYQASRLGVQVGDADPTLGGGSHAKFDPRQFDNGYAPYQHEGSVSSMMRGSSNPARGAFG